MADLIMDPAAWAEMEFGDCDLGDLRRTRRAVRFAAQVARNPGASTPGQAKEWKDLKAAYRLLDMDDVTFEALAKPHWLRTRNPPRGTWLLLCGETSIERAADTASRKKKKAPGETTGGNSLGPSIVVKKTIVAALAGRARTVAARDTARRVKWCMGFLPERCCRCWRRASEGHAQIGPELRIILNSIICWGPMGTADPIL